MGDEVVSDGSKLVKICFKDHREKFVSGLWNLLKADRWLDFDFRLVANGSTQRAHRLVLEALLGVEIIDRIQAGNFVLDPNKKLELCYASANLESFLEFLYRGEVNVPEERLEGLLEIGRNLDLDMQVVTSDNEPEERPVVGTEDSTKHIAVCTRSRVRKSAVPRRVPGPHVSSDSRLWNTDIGFNTEDDVADSEEFDELTDNEDAEEYETDGCHLSDDGNCQNQIVANAELEQYEEASEREITPLSSSSKSSEHDISKPIATPSKKQTPLPASFQRHNVMTSRCPPPPKVRLTSRPAILNCEYCEYQTRDETYLRLHTAVHEFPQRFAAREDSKEKATRARTTVNATSEPVDGVQDSECVSNVAISVGRTPKSVPAIEQAHTSVSTSQPPPNIKATARYRCDMCRKPFNSQSVLDRHNRTKHKVNKCPHCPPDKPYESNKVWCYAHHLFSVHQVNNRGDVIEQKKCHTCAYTCRTDKLLKTHIMLKHCGERQYKCPEVGCPYTSGRKGDLGRHIKVTHLGIKPYLCETCGHRTINQYKLDKHYLTHTGGNKIACTVCGKLFSGNSSLKLHMTLHESDLKPHVCHVCGNAFSRHYNLSAHLKNVHKFLVESRVPKYKAKYF